MRKELKTDLTKAKIMKAAMNEFGANGYAASSLNNICNTGISKGLLYHNFAGKDELYLSCTAQCFHMLTEHLKASDIGTDLHQYANARLSFFREHPNEARIFFESLLQPPEPLKEKIAKLRAEFDDFNQKKYEQILDGIILRPGVTKTASMHYLKLMQDMFNGYFTSPAVSKLSFAETLTVHEEGLTKMFDFILYGIAQRGENK